MKKPIAIFLLLFLCNVTYHLISQPPFLRHWYNYLTGSSTFSIAYVVIKGDIMEAQQLYFDLLKIDQNASIDALILLIDSSGGGSTYGHRIAQMIEHIKKHKKVIAVIEAQGTSAAYNIACTADWIICHETSAIGSIGTAIRVAKKHDTIDFGSGSFKNTHYKSDGHLHEDHVAFLQEKVDIIATRFQAHVAKQRNLSLEFIKNLEARWYTGEQALELHLVDQLGGLEQGLLKAVELSRSPINQPITTLELFSPNGVLIATYDYAELTAAFG